MADNYLEKQMEQYQARKAAWERTRKYGKQPKKPATPQPAMLHRYATPTDNIERPAAFTYPFCYTPHPLAVLAAEEVKNYLKSRNDWAEELQQGKMFGVLVVSDARGQLGFLAAYSGLLAGRNDHPYFVPPVYDLLNPGGFFKIEEEEISQINRRISELETDESYRNLQVRLKEAEQAAQQELQQARQELKKQKALRDQRRKDSVLTDEEAAALIRESQFQKAELKRKERALNEALQPLREELTSHEARIEQLKTERKHRSADLQQRLFARFSMLNARGERKDLCRIFAETVHKTPPSGSGECAAPKLLQQAYLHHWKPVAMAEFWWGDSPRNEIRHHGCYYPACKGKCEPILTHMLQGLNVEPNPLRQQLNEASVQEPEIVYEDPWIAVVCKPAGMLSVPGKEETVSLYDLMRRRYPEADGPLLVHRLDMGTSGLLLVAKDKQTHQNLQAQFKHQRIRKRYIALLEGTVEQDEGCIELPLCPDHLDRPRQRVDAVHGKPAVTRYQVLERMEHRTRIAFYPLTGRTHQLRVHAAHPDGLHCPIVGDELYGTKADRLYLHAEMLEFVHPATGETVHVEKPADF